MYKEPNQTSMSCDQYKCESAGKLKIKLKRKNDKVKHV